MRLSVQACVPVQPQLFHDECLIAWFLGWRVVSGTSLWAAACVWLLVMAAWLSPWLLAQTPSGGCSQLWLVKY